MPEPPSWEAIDALVNDGNVREALAQTVQALAEARSAGDDSLVTHALVKRTQLETALGGFETAVRDLRAEPWPEDPRWRTVLELFYAHSLVHYVQVYGWEIAQRETVVSSDTPDLRRWTHRQLVDEIHRAMVSIWRSRAAWGDSSLGPLAPYVAQNEYPARIRGTLRDTIVYLWSTLLVDSALWRTADTDDARRLDRDLLFEEARAADDAVVADPDLHPLRRLAAISGDLESWHREHDRPEAALEARLARLAALGRHLDRAEDRQRIEADLRTATDRLLRRYPWWSMGMAALAEHVRNGEGGRALADALAIATEGAEAHPETPGGQRCSHLAASIVAPAYTLEGMAVDGPDRASIGVRHKDLDRLHFRAFALDLDEVIAAGHPSVVPGPREIAAWVRQRTADAVWAVDLEAPDDHRFHRTEVVPPFSDNGLYVIVASGRADFAEASNQLQALVLQISDLVLLVHSDVETAGGTYAEVRVLSGRTGRPLEDAEISLLHLDHRRGVHETAARHRTGADGRVRFLLPADRRGQYMLLARHDGQVVLDRNRLSMRRLPPERQRETSLVYTDRAAYRPGQDLLFKVVAYRHPIGGRNDQTAGRHRVLPDREVRVSLYDANGEEIAAQTLTTNAFGSVSGSFRLPSGRLLGQWQVRANPLGQATVTVEEYKRPTFEVSIDDPETPLRLGKSARLRGSARYHFGLPVTEGEVGWTVTREPVMPWWRSFGGWWHPPRPTGTSVIATGRAELDAEGRFEISFLPEADERDAESGLTWRYRLAAEVTDGGGETRSSSRDFRLGFVSIEAAVTTADRFVPPATPARLTVERRDLDGIPRAGRGTWTLVRLAAPEKALLPAEVPFDPVGAPDAQWTAGDRRRPRWAGEYRPESVLRAWNDGDVQATGHALHGDDGRAAIDFGRLPAGAYRLVYRTADPEGAELEVRHELLVAGKDAHLPLAAVLRAAEPTVAVGEAARLLVHSGLVDQPIALDIYRAHGAVERRDLAPSDGPRVIELPITEADRGGIAVRLVAVRDHQLMTQDVEIAVPWDDLRLDVSFETFRDHLRPGGEEAWRVVVRGREGAVAAGAVELLAAMYDKSLDLFAQLTPPDPFGFYHDRRRAPALRTNLGLAERGWTGGRGLAHVPRFPPLVGDRLVFLDSYGIGGPGRGGPISVGLATMKRQAFAEGQPLQAAAAESESVSFDMPDAAPAAAPPPSDPSSEGDGGRGDDIRRDFSETAFWLPHLLTDEDGGVSFRFVVPDAVTQWQVWVHALTRDLRAGRTERTARSAKDLLVRPYLPRFLREGDQATLTVAVQNSGDATLSGRLRFTIVDPETDEDLSAGFGLGPETVERDFTVAPGASDRLTFEVEAPEQITAAAVRVVGRSGETSDGELRPLPILPARTRLAESRFAALRDQAPSRVLRFEEADRAEDRDDDQVVVTVDGQLVFSVLRAVPYLVNNPYEHTEAILQRYTASAILTRIFDDHPSVARAATGFAARETPFERFDHDDPNRTMALEETPWLTAARGGDAGSREVVRLLDPKIAAATRDGALARLRQLQNADGGFPWFGGGPSSPYMTIYLTHGMARALEMGADVPRDLVTSAWGYLGEYHRRELTPCLEESRCTETATFLNYVLSAYPDVSWTGGVITEDDRTLMLDRSFARWRKHSPLLKGYLALTLARAERLEDARIVLDSVLDSARTTPDGGTDWAPEERAWLWYNDTVDGHAFILRALDEVTPGDPRIDGLVQWLFLDKKLNHWSSTRSTAEALYALVRVLAKRDMLDAGQQVEVRWGDHREQVSFSADDWQPGRGQIVLSGDVASDVTDGIRFEKAAPGLVFASVTRHFTAATTPASKGGLFGIERRYFRRLATDDGFVLEPLSEGATISPGDQIEVQISVRARHAAEFIQLQDPRPAGLEPEHARSGFRWDRGLGWYEVIRDSGTSFFFEHLPAGEYTLHHRLRANVAGRFRVAPATLHSVYAPEFAAHSNDAILVVGGGAP